MIKKRTINWPNEQSIFDIALYEYGRISAIFSALYILNPTIEPFDEQLTGEITIDAQIANNAINNYYKTKSIVPATYPIESGAEFSTEYAYDFKS